MASGGATGSGGSQGTGGATAGGTGGGSLGGSSASGGNTGGNSAGGRGGGGGGRGGRGGNTANGGSGVGGGGTASPMMNFFVTSDTSTTGNLGGLMGADARCQRLAAAVGQGAKTWRAYLSTANPAFNAIDRIGPGPYYNADGMVVAADKAALHARTGESTLFITEVGARINGQWIGSPVPNEHDILTGSQRDGTLMAGSTCSDWMAATGASQVGHVDGLGPNQATTGDLSSWNSAHGGLCNDTALRGGAGRLYCFVGP